MTDKMLGLNFDMKRPMWKREYMDAVVDHLARWGFNTIVYEIEDKFRWDNHPAISHPEAPTHEETASFVHACRDKGLEVVPLMQSLGHAESVVGKPEYAHLRETPEVGDQYDPLSKEARALIFALFDEIIDVFQPKEYFHMGGDETWSLGKSEKCAAIVREIGVGGLYLKHMLPIFEHIHKRGLRPIIWADIALSHPEIIKNFPKYVLMMDWDYWTHEERPHSIMVWGSGHVIWEQYQKLDNSIFKKCLERYCVDEQTWKDSTFRQFYCTDALGDMGFDVLTASAASCYGDMVGVPFHKIHLPNSFYSARKGITSGLGNLVTSWAVRRCHPELKLVAPFAAAFALKDKKHFDVNALFQAFTTDFYGVEMPEFAGALEKAQRGFRLGQACFISAARSKFQAGEDPMMQEVDAIDEEQGGREEAIAFLDQTMAGYIEARTMFEGMKDKAKRNADNFDYWLEGVDLNALYGAFLRASLTDTLKDKASKLRNRIGEFRENTRRLFTKTYMPQGVEDELDLRYGFHEEYLKWRGEG